MTTDSILTDLFLPRNRDLLALWVLAVVALVLIVYLVASQWQEYGRAVRETANDWLPTDASPKVVELAARRRSSLPRPVFAHPDRWDDAQERRRLNAVVAPWTLDRKKGA